MKNNYLLIPNGNIDSFWEDVKKYKMPIFSRLIDLYHFYSKESLPIEHPSSSLTYFGYAAVNLSLSYLLTKQDHFLEEAKRWILTGVKYSHWGKVTMVDQGLDAGWLLFGFSLSYNWIGDFLSYSERNLLLEKIIFQGEKLYTYVEEHEGNFWVSSYHNSYNWVCFTALATAAYAIKDEYPEAEKWLVSAKSNFSNVLSVLADDGSFFSGVSFWRYTISWLLKSLDLFKSQDDLDLFQDSSFLKNTFYFRLYLSASNLEEIIDFGDCHDRKSGHCPAAYYKLASLYNNGHAQFLGDYVLNNIAAKEHYESNIKPGIFHEVFLELLWYDPTVKAEPIYNLPKVKYFEDMGLVVIRSGWNRDALHFSFKCGCIGGKKAWKKAFDISKEKGWRIISASHMHPDNNSFILGAYDTFLAVDDGYSHSKKTSNHNTILVDDVGYANDGSYNIFSDISYDVTANIQEFINEKDYVFVTGETAKFYAPELCLNSFSRNIFYSSSDYIIIVDELSSSNPHKYKWLLNSDVEAKRMNDTTFKIENGKGLLYISCLEPKSFTASFTNKSISANPSSSTPDFIIKKKIKTLTLESNNTSKNMRFITLLSVNSILNDKPFTIIEIRNDTCLGYQITFEEYTDIFLWSIGESINYEAIQTDASWIFLRVHLDKIKKYGLYHCSLFKYKGIPIISVPQKNNIFT